MSTWSPPECPNSNGAARTSRTMLAASTSVSGGIRNDWSPSSSVATPARPNHTTGPNIGSSAQATTTGTPCPAIFCTTNRASEGSPIVADSVVHAERISSSVAMFRQTSARSGRCRRWGAAPLSTTSQPSLSATTTASSIVATGWVCQTSIP
jgi:hypothetical protein